MSTPALYGTTRPFRGRRLHHATVRGRKACQMTTAVPRAEAISSDLFFDPTVS